jgi:hypothetical protein
MDVMCFCEAEDHPAGTMTVDVVEADVAGVTDWTI